MYDYGNILLYLGYESEVAQSCPTLSHPVDCSPPGSSVHGILQARLQAKTPAFLMVLPNIFISIEKIP